MNRLDLGHIAKEYAEANLGDERRTRRLEKLAVALEADPSATLPQAMKTEADLEGCYRFLNNERVKASDILGAHAGRTIQRCESFQETWVVHDTTSVTAREDERIEGMGPLTTKDGRKGFYAHISMAISPTALRDPLGVVTMKTYRRSDKRSYSSKVKTLAAADNEYRRWKESVDAVEQTMGRSTSVIHVMDREADVYELFAHFTHHGYRFVTRLSDDRATPQRSGIGRGHVRISDVLEGLEALGERHVSLSRRKGRGGKKARKIHPPRHERIARLSMRATPIELRRPEPLPKHLPPSLTLHLVHVLELDPPQGQAPVEWKLLTTESIDTADDILRVVDIYRARWRIEELFKALKTGCSFEDRMLQSFDAFERLLAVFLPIAWRLLRLRTLAACAPDHPATAVLSPTQIAVLRRVNPRAPLPQLPTVLDAFIALAGLGGHLKRNGPPGWQVLGRGLDSLLKYELGWRAARELEM